MKTDHNKVKKLLASIEKSKDLQLFEELKKELLIHNEAEEETFYDPLQEKAGKLKIIVKTGHNEHNMVTKMLKQLDKIGDEEEWIQLFSVVKKSLEAHIIMEEQEMFTLAQKHFSNEEAERMGANMAKSKEKILKKYKN